MKGEEELVERDGDELVEEEEEENEHGGIVADAPQAQQLGHCPQRSHSRSFFLLQV